MDIKVDLTKVIGWSENSRPIEENNGRKKCNGHQKNYVILKNLHVTIIYQVKSRGKL